ncbi:hypothetical protein [Tropheryma whipplei]|nr:hypothetical protein [Tropheryma whipplei]
MTSTLPNGNTTVSSVTAAPLPNGKVTFTWPTDVLTEGGQEYSKQKNKYQ